MRRALVLALLAIALIPCGLLGDGCDEVGCAGCSQLCHLGCAAMSMPASPLGGAEPLLLVRHLAAGLAEHPRALAKSPEPPPPRA